MITRRRFRRHMLREVLRAVQSMKEDAMDLGAMAHVLYLLTRGRDYEPFLIENRETYFREWIRTLEDRVYKKLRHAPDRQKETWCNAEDEVQCVGA